MNTSDHRTLSNIAHTVHRSSGLHKFAETLRISKMASSSTSLTKTPYEKYMEDMVGFKMDTIIECMDSVGLLINGEVMKLLINTMGYSGFDPIKMRKHIMSKLKDSKQDIPLLVTVAILRGANTVRLIKTMKESDMKKRLQLLFKNLNVKPKVEADSSVVTLPRIAACYPEIVCTLLHKTELSGAVTVDNVKAVTSSSHFPKAAMHHCVASLFPLNMKDKHFKIMVAVVMVPYLMLSELINSKNSDWKRRTPSDKFRTALSYLMSSYHSALLEEEIRRIACAKLSIFNRDGMSSDWEAAYPNCQKYLKARYNYDVDTELAQ